MFMESNLFNLGFAVSFAVGTEFLDICLLCYSGAELNRPFFEGGSLKVKFLLGVEAK